MRVFQVINHAGLDRGGAERLAHFLHQDLLAAGVEAHLIALGACDLAGMENAISLNMRSPRSPLAIWKLYRKLRTVRKNGDIVHAHLFPTTFAVSTLKQSGLLRAPCTMTEHNTWNRRRDMRLGRALDRFIYNGYDRIAAISSQTKDALLSGQPQLKDRAVVVNNGAQLRFRTLPEREYAPAVPVILSLGRLVTQKNYPVALRALAQIKDRPWEYLIAGSGADEAALREQADSLGISEKVRFLGHVSDIGPLLEKADIFLMPSRWEGFGLAAVEAMNAGLPLIASDVPGLRELVGPTGAHLVSPDDPDAIAASLNALLSDPEQRRRIGQAGFLHAAGYDTSQMTQAYISLWADLCDGGAS